MDGSAGDWVLLGLAFALGVRHAFDADHLAAVGAFVGARPRPGSAVRFAWHWGLGHGMALLAAGGAIVAFRIAVPRAWETRLELLVGALMVGVGLWTLWLLLRRRPVHIHAHNHEGSGEGLHVHGHSHLWAADHRHSHALLWVGAVHGLAGTATVTALLPVALLSSFVAAMLYLVAFGAGTVLGMGLYALAVSRLFSAVSGWRRVEAGVAACTSLASVGVGLAWILRALPPGAG